jgi:PleD family two-component response regulator
MMPTWKTPRRSAKILEFVFVETVDEVLEAALEPMAVKLLKVRRHYAEKEKQEEGKVISQTSTKGKVRIMIKVMLVEDDATMLGLLNMLLEMEGFGVVKMTGDDPETLLDTIRQERPALVVLYR